MAENAEQVVDEFIRRLVAQDLDGACELVTDDVEYDNVPMGKNVGPDGIKAILEPMVAGVDEVQFVVHRQVARGNVVMNERNDRFLINGKWLDLPVMGVFEVGDQGLITLWRDYFDLPTLMNQMQEMTAG
jgi:limonene-1,2-epoxide hydrolase